MSFDWFIYTLANMEVALIHMSWDIISTVHNNAASMGELFTQNGSDTIIIIVLCNQEYVLI